MPLIFASVLFLNLQVFSAFNTEKLNLLLHLCCCFSFRENLSSFFWDDIETKMSSLIKSVLIFIPIRVLENPM